MQTKMSQYVLGVDAAWTPDKPSGVALLKCPDDAKSKPRLIKVARSYLEFSSDNKPEMSKPASGSSPDICKLVDSCKDDERNVKVDVVALDIPLSPDPITGRRAADDAISRKYWRHHAGTHTPNETRPGTISKTIYAQLNECHYSWRSSKDDCGVLSSFIEVYPHPAIIELWGYPERLKYKAHSARKEIVVKNLEELSRQVAKIVSIDDNPFSAISLELTLKQLKGYEDMLDAIVCALVGWRFLQRHAEPYGDKVSAIWVPKH